MQKLIQNIKDTNSVVKDAKEEVKVICKEVDSLLCEVVELDESIKTVITNIRDHVRKRRKNIR